MGNRDYNYWAQRLQKYLDRKEREGSNYVTDYYIKEAQGKVDALSTTPNPPWHIKENKCNKQDWDEILDKRIKQLKRKIQSHKAGWVDHMLYDLYTGKDITKIKYFVFEEESI